MGGARPGSPASRRSMVVVDSRRPRHDHRAAAAVRRSSRPLLPAVGADRAVRRGDGERRRRHHQAQGEPVTRSGLDRAHHARVRRGGDGRLIAERRVLLLPDPRGRRRGRRRRPDATAYAHRSANFSVAAFGASRAGARRGPGTRCADTSTGSTSASRPTRGPSGSTTPSRRAPGPAAGAEAPLRPGQHLPRQLQRRADAPPGDLSR